MNILVVLGKLDWNKMVMIYMLIFIYNISYFYKVVECIK